MTLTPKELEAQVGEELPDLEAMSLINGNVAAPVNLVANAEQNVDITQST